MTGNAQVNDAADEQADDPQAVDQINELQIAIQRALLPINRRMDKTLRQGWIGCKKAKLTRLLGQQLLPPLPAFDPKDSSLGQDYRAFLDKEPTLTLADLLPGSVCFDSVLNQNEVEITQSEGELRVRALGDLLGAKACIAYWHNQDLLPAALKYVTIHGFPKSVVFAGTPFVSTRIESHEKLYLSLIYDKEDERFRLQQLTLGNDYHHSVIIPYLKK